MVCDLTNRKIKRILVECPEAVKNLFPTAPNHLFESGYLRISVLGSGEWRVTNNYVDGDRSLMFASTSPLLQSSRVAKVFQCKVKSCPAELFWLMQELEEISLSTNWERATPITVLDYATPERADIKSHLVAQTEPFTTRAVLLKISEQSAILGRHGSYKMPDGFSFEMMEATLRAV